MLRCTLVPPGCPSSLSSTTGVSGRPPTHARTLRQVDAQYDAFAADFIRGAVAASEPFFFYFASHHTHVPQFHSKAMGGFTLRGLQGDSLAMFDRSVGRMLAVLDAANVAENTLVVVSADNGGARYWGPDTGGVNGELKCGKLTTWEGPPHAAGMRTRSMPWVRSAARPNLVRCVELLPATSPLATALLSPAGGHRVPTIVRWPGVVPAGTVNPRLISSLDW